MYEYLLISVPVIFVIQMVYYTSRKKEKFNTANIFHEY